MARHQLTGLNKFFDDFMFGGAEQQTIEREQEAEEQQFIRDYDGEFEIVSVRSDQGVFGSCSKCGASIAGQYADLGDEIYLCTSCTDEKVEKRGYDKNYLPWNQWRLPTHKKPIKLG